jgi:hypothetical protein
MVAQRHPSRSEGSNLICEYLREIEYFAQCLGVPLVHLMRLADNTTLLTAQLQALICAPAPVLGRMD